MSYYNLARELAESSIVLLKNEKEILPLKCGQCVAIFGRTQTETILSGNGSGAVSTESAINILEACEEKGFHPVKKLAEFYRNLKKPANDGTPDWENMAAMSKLVHSGAIYEYFGKYRPTPEEAKVSKELITQAARQTDTAIYVLGRCAGGEECDRHMEDDYYLSVIEKNIIEQVCNRFSKIVLILNTNGIIDLSWVEKYPSIQGILFLGVPGEAGPAALSRILVGEIAPSGKMAVTIPAHYEDFPCAKHFSWNKDNLAQIKTYADYGLDAWKNGSNGFEISPVTVYREGIYNGYRFFDTFHIEPMYPFGYGLSYTKFDYDMVEICKKEEGMELNVSVKNIGRCDGREIIQIYIDTRQVPGDAPDHTLQGFAKTEVLMPGRSETLRILIPWRSFARYREENAAWIIMQGRYGICLGQDSCHMEEIAGVDVPQTILAEQAQNLFGIRPVNYGRLDFLHHENLQCENKNEKINNADFVLLQEDIVCQTLKKRHPIRDLSGFSVEELSALCVGYGPGTPFSAFGDGKEPCTIYDKEGNPITQNDHPSGMNGYISPAIPERGIHSVSYKDGPAGIGDTAWPSEMLIACSFDERLCEAFGDAVGSECEDFGVDIWLSPAVNLHRHPLCGRAFEYFSEDPFLTGRLACAIVRGVQEKHPVLVCPKHFAANEQESFRRGNARLNIDAADSIVEERALRELYLRPFEMLVREGKIHCIMTSFNKINGTFTAGNEDLCTCLLRGEWGFDGAVVTDWGDMDTVVDGADAVVAGNDIVMPGGPPVIKQIIQGFQKGKVSRRQLETAVGHLLDMLCRIRQTF